MVPAYALAWHALGSSNLPTPHSTPRSHTTSQAVVDTASVDKAAVEKAAAENAAAENAAAKKAVLEKAAVQKAVAEKAAAEKSAGEEATAAEAHAVAVMQTGTDTLASAVLQAQLKLISREDLQRAIEDARSAAVPAKAILAAEALLSTLPVTVGSSKLVENEASQLKLLAAADHVLANHYSKPYTVPKLAKDDEDFWYLDLDAVHGVERPNHGLGNAMRKAALVRPVVKAYRDHYTGGGLGSFDFSEWALLVMEVALLFEVCGRETDIGFNDNATVFMGYHEASCKAFAEYTASCAHLDPTAAATCLEGLERMYMHPKSERSKPVKHILEMCHDLDLCRCYGESKMTPKLEATARDVGQPACDALACTAEAAILATGDRLSFSPSGGGGLGYVKSAFVICSRNPLACLKAALSGDAPPPAPPSALKVAGEGRVRFISSQYKLLHASKMSRWRATRLDEQGVGKFKQAYDIFEAVKGLVVAFGASQNVSQPKTIDYLKRLENVAFAKLSEEGVENMAVRLWTSVEKYSGRELCSILNEAVRNDARAAGVETAAPGADCAADMTAVLLQPAVTLACMIQYHLNMKRRSGDKQRTQWPEGPEAPLGMGRSCEPNTTFRGAELPEQHKSFFEALAQAHGADASCGVYRVPMLLATSFEKRVAVGFINRVDDSKPKVLFTVRLDCDLGCKQVNYLGKTEVEGEAEFLFSAYSVFRVQSVQWSESHEFSASPHKITLLASPGNAVEPEDMPTAPWH